MCESRAVNICTKLNYLLTIKMYYVGIQFGNANITKLTLGYLKFDAV